MTETKAAKQMDRKQEAAQRGGKEEEFDRPDADTAAEGGAPHEHPSPSGGDRRAPRNDAEHGYSQDSGYATSGGPSAGAKQKPKRG